MPEGEQAPSLLTEFEQAKTPEQALAIGRLFLRRAVTLPLAIGRDIMEIIKSGDPGEMARRSSYHQ
jgi:hypothetical protein